ncbi:MAG: TraR/DksA family transcriptional regulator [Acidimicrobiales bacterium]
MDEPEALQDEANPFDVAVLEALEAEVREVERALRRLDDGTYGRCEACGSAIPEQELAARPTTRHCPEHLPLAIP